VGGGTLKAAVLSPPAPAATASTGGGVAGGAVDALAPVLTRAAPPALWTREAAVAASIARRALTSVRRHAGAVLAAVRTHRQTPFLCVVLHIARTTLLHRLCLHYSLKSIIRT